MGKLRILLLCLRFLAKLLFQLLNSSLMLSPQVIHLLTLHEQLSAQLVLILRVNLVLLAQFL